jgi:hypothetical protein
MASSRGNRLSGSFQGFTSDDGDVDWPEPAYQIEDAIHQVVALSVAELAQSQQLARLCDAQMFVAVRVATGTVQRTFLGDLDG